MGSPISDFVDREERSLDGLSRSGSVAAVDTAIWMHQFIHKITDDQGRPFTDGDGRVTSHVSGLFYRSVNLRRAGIDLVFVLEGDVPELKKPELESRRESREQAQREWEIAQMVGDDEWAADKETERRGITDDMITSATDLIRAMGFPVVSPPSEADAQCARMCSSEQVDYVISQDYDTLLYGGTTLVQNLDSSSGEIVRLSSSSFSQTELIWVGLLLGTDYNHSPSGVGPVTARNIAQESDSIGNVIDAALEYDDIDPERWRAANQLYRQPRVDLDIDWEITDPDPSKIRSLLVDRHDFSPDRVDSAIDRLSQSSFSEFP